MCQHYNYKNTDIYNIHIAISVYARPFECKRKVGKCVTKFITLKHSKYYKLRHVTLNNSVTHHIFVCQASLCHNINVNTSPTYYMST